MRNVGLKLISSFIESFGHNYMKILLTLIDQLLLNRDYFSLQLKALDESFCSLQSTTDFAESAKFVDLKAVFMSSAFDSERLVWKRKEVAFLLLGSFSEDVLEFQSATPGFDPSTLVRSVLGELRGAEERILEARGLWCLSRLVGTQEESQAGILEELMTLSYNALRQAKHVALKLVAAKACSL